MIKTIAKILPFILIEKLVKSFSHDFVTLRIGNTEIKGKFWRTGNDEGFFISDLSEMKNHYEKQKRKLEEYEEKIRKLEEAN